MTIGSRVLGFAMYITYIDKLPDPVGPVNNINDRCRAYFELIQ